jgi:hypothetical protein
MAWNVNHRAVQRKIPPTLANAIASLEPDVVVLTEFVPGTTREKFKSDLAELGFGFILLSQLTPKQNHVLIASRTSIELGSIRAPAIAPSIPSNFLHVILRQENLNVIGLRIPDYSKQPSIRRQCWDWIAKMAAEVVDHPTVLIGDFNTDASYPPSRCGDRIQQLIDSNWQHPIPPQGHSYWTPKGHGVCIDHAFVSKHFKVKDVRFITEYAGHVFVGKDKGGLSDHAVLIINIESSHASSQY